MFPIGFTWKVEGSNHPANNHFAKQKNPRVKNIHLLCLPLFDSANAFTHTISHVLSKDIISMMFCMKYDVYHLDSKLWYFKIHRYYSNWINKFWFFPSDFFRFKTDEIYLYILPCMQSWLTVCCNCTVIESFPKSLFNHLWLSDSVRTISWNNFVIHMKKSYGGKDACLKFNSANLRILPVHTCTTLYNITKF